MTLLNEDLFLEIVKQNNFNLYELNSLCRTNKQTIKNIF